MHRTGSGAGSCRENIWAPGTLPALICLLARNCSDGIQVSRRLILLTPLLFPETLTREGLFGSTLLTRFHVVAVLLDLLDDVLRLHFSLEPPKGILQRFALLNDDFRHAYSPPFPVLSWTDWALLVQPAHSEPVIECSSIGGYPPSQGQNLEREAFRVSQLFSNPKCSADSIAGGARQLSNP